MAMPLQALLFSLFFLSAHSLPEGAHNEGFGQRKLLTNEENHSTFQPGPWKQAHATFYEGSSSSFGGACGYEDVVKDAFGLETAALSKALFNEGAACGACYEIRCVNSPQWCNPNAPSLFVTATNFCPPNFAQSSENGGWCNPPREHFDLAKPAYLKIAAYKAGIVPIQYRRVPCKKQGGIRFSITGNPYFNLVKVWNVGGAGDVTSVQVMGDNKLLQWTDLKRNWGQKWVTSKMLVGETLSFRITTSDGRTFTSSAVAPKNWQFGQTYEGKNLA